MTHMMNIYSMYSCAEGVACGMEVEHSSRTTTATARSASRIDAYDDVDRGCPEREDMEIYT